MTGEKKLELLEDMLEMDAGTLSPEMALDDMDEWDSIALMMFIALLNHEFDRVIRRTDIKGLKTVSDLMALMERK